MNRNNRGLGTFHLWFEILIFLDQHQYLYKIMSYTVLEWLDAIPKKSG